MNIINKIIRKLSGAELAQKQAAAVLGGKANESIVPLLRKAGADGCVLPVSYTHLTLPTKA